MDEQPIARPAKPIGPLRAKPVWFGLVTFVLIGTLAYRLIYLGGLSETAALFIGLPALLAYYLVWSNPAGGGPYMTLTTCMTFFLLLTAVLLGEGTVCLLFIAPIAFVVGFATTWLVIRLRTDKDRRQRHILRVCVGLPLVILSLEGVLPYSSYERTSSISHSMTTNLDASSISDKLQDVVVFDEEWPWLLALGFPLPKYSDVEGMMRRVQFGGAEGFGGLQQWRLRQIDPRHWRWELVQDSTPMARWVRWQAIDLHHTDDQVKVQIHWTRSIDPGWYFGPLQEMAMHHVADRLLTELHR